MSTNNCDCQPAGLYKILKDDVTAVENDTVTPEVTTAVHLND